MNNSARIISIIRLQYMLVINKNLRIGHAKDVQHLKDAFVRVIKEYLAFQDFPDLEGRMEYRVSLDPRGHGVLRVRKGLLASMDLKVRRATEESMVCQASGELQAYRYGKTIIIIPIMIDITRRIHRKILSIEGYARP